MRPERWQRVEQIYHSALERNASQRAAFLVEACQGDEELRKEVESLLGQGQTSTGILERPAWEAAGDLLESRTRQGTTLLHYEIVAKIGEGGMGRVFKARDVKLDRFVALKFLAPHLLASADARSRFRQEARALSALNHPHIATIFNVEEVDGEPFLVLEYLSGGTLSAKVKSAAESGHKLALSQLLEYAIQIGEGLAHAHRNHVVHRDVKTGNVLLSAEGALKITDFGLAKFRGTELITGPGDALGTVAYMSPEQAQGREVDHRSDIFSFGVVLYEIAAAERPFRGDHEQAIIHQILTASPPPLADRRPDLPRGFEDVVLKALQKDPERRYQRTEELVDDLRRLRSQSGLGADDLSRMPTRSLRPENNRRAAVLRWAAGITFALVALVTAFVALPGLRGSLVRLVSHSQIQSERHLAVLPFANVGADPAGQAFSDGVVESLTSSLTQLERFQGSLLVVPASEVRRQSITSVRDAQRAFGVNLVVSGSVQHSGDGVRLTVNLDDARTLRQLGARTVDMRREELSRMEDRLVALVAELLELQLQPQAKKALKEGSTSVADAYDAYLQGRGYLRRYDLAGNLERAISAFQQALQRDRGYALAFAGLSEAYWRDFGRTKDAQWLEQARVAGSRAIELDDRLAPAHVNLGTIYATTGQYGKAIEEFKRALELDPISADAYREMGRVYEAQNKTKDAEDTYRRATQLRAADWSCAFALGAFYYRRGRYSEAEPLFQKVIDLTPDNFNGYVNLGGLYIATGRYGEAEKLLKKSLELKPTYQTYSNLGTLYYQLGRYTEAVSMYERAVQASSNYVVVGNLADSYRWAAGFEQKALPTYRRAVELAEQQLAINPRNASVLSRLAWYRAHAGDRAKAVNEIQRARKLAPADTEVAFKAALVYEFVGRRADALSTLDELLGKGYHIEEVKNEPEFAKLRRDPIYLALASRYSN